MAVVVSVSYLTSSFAHAEALRTLYAFTGGADGATPLSGLVPDVEGNLYGTTQSGGFTSKDICTQGCGTVYRLDKKGVLTTLHTFTAGPGGQSPVTGVSLFRGLLYGSTGAVLDSPAIVYSMRPDGSAFTILHSFTTAEGARPQGSIQPSFNGGVVGVAATGGAHDDGTLFTIGPEGRFQVLVNFGGPLGSSPTALLEDANGNLYGSTLGGGKGGYGVVFEYVQKTHSYSILYTFQDGEDGRRPLLGAVDANGVLYGVTQFGGAQMHGALFSIAPVGAGWSFKVLSPIESPAPGDYAVTPPTLSSTGALVGETIDGGIYTLQNSQYSIIRQTNADVGSPLFVPRTYPKAIEGTSSGGGGVLCAVPNLDSCGFIFAGRH